MSTGLDPAALSPDLRSRMTGLLGVLQVTHAATTDLRLPVVGAHLADAYAVLSDATGQHAARYDARVGASVGTLLAALRAAVADAGKLRRQAWTWAAEDGADILHGGPRTRHADALAAVLNYLQAAIEAAGKGTT